MNRLERIKGCLLGSAVGDALGAQGIFDFAPTYGRIGAVTDDTQMMLFTAEGLLRMRHTNHGRPAVSGASGALHVDSLVQARHTTSSDTFK